MGQLLPRELAGSEQAIEDVHSDVLSSVPDPFAPLATNLREHKIFVEQCNAKLAPPVFMLAPAASNEAQANP